MDDTIEQDGADGLDLKYDKRGLVNALVDWPCRLLVCSLAGWLERLAGQTGKAHTVTDGLTDRRADQRTDRLKRDKLLIDGLADRLDCREDKTGWLPMNRQTDKARQDKTT